MGVVPEAADQIDTGSNEERTFTPLPAGTYQGEVVELRVNQEPRKTWRQTELVAKLRVTEGEHSGSVTFFDVETSPLTGKDGQISPGKVKYLSWQLAMLGYEGKMSEFELSLPQMMGARVEFEQKVETSDKVNPHTGLNYENREVTLMKHLGSGSVDDIPEIPQAPQSY